MCLLYTFNKTISRSCSPLIGRYQKATRDKSLILKPKTEMAINCLVNSNSQFCGDSKILKDHQVRKAAHAIFLNLVGCPVIWSSQLQTNIALSTIEAEYDALSMSWKERLPFKHFLLSNASSVDIPIYFFIKMKTTVWEENTGAVSLARQELG
jgi:hypothetical protein